MAMNIDKLKQLVEGENLKYFIDPRRPALMMGVSGLSGHYQFIVILEQDGTFLQFRTLQYAQCAADHPHLQEVLKTLGGIDYRVRFVKFGWDQSDGEIVAYGDICLAEDGSLTQAQFKHMIRLFMTVIDVSSMRIKKTIETGKDPGETDPAALAAQMLGQRGLPEGLRTLLEKLRAGKPESGPEGATAPKPPIDEI